MEFLKRRVALPVWALVVGGLVLVGLGSASAAKEGATETENDRTEAVATVPVEDTLPFASTTEAPTTTKAPTTTVATTLPRSTVATTAPRVATTRPPATTQPTAAVQPSTYYRNCSEARAAGAAPVRRGDAGYAPHLDRDDDGVGCE
ncbi:MAG: excalibur calcium-binding domain-containing protein [Actinomycetota bacterium]|nr:excalibur calcium-binding domain-containing protein [Actinomycetota bacterium]